MNTAHDARRAELRGVMRNNECLARHTVWGIGGPADRFYEPADVNDLALFISTLPEHEPIFWLGLGSNLLVRDGGIAGTVIAVGAGLGAVERKGDDGIRAEAGVACPKLAKRCAQYGLAGAEFFAGIPGTLGGALAMNAGAFGGETWKVVSCVQSVDRGGSIHHRCPSEYRVGYRSVAGPHDEWFVAAELKLERDEPEAVDRRIRALLKRRGDSQPMGYRSCGSVFRNPPGDFAARLIEASGLKGTRIGDAVVSEKHANFILNLGEARAADVESLIRYVAERVRSDHGIALEREVHIVGRPLRDASESIGGGTSP
jgi:UDP-N-acetylmuramate dehydrogenase